MPRKPYDELIDRQRGWLDPLGKKLVPKVRWIGRAGGGRGSRVLDFAHGVWLGHPLHPVLSDVPVGAWTAAFVLDVIEAFAPRRALRGCADASIALGIAAGLPTASTGITDWHHTSGHTRRLGLVHGLLNAGGLIFYITSLVLRRGRTRPLGVSLSMLSYGVVSLSAYLGGELVYRLGIGVNHTAWGAAPPRDFVPVLPEGELAENTPRRVEANGLPIVLVRRHGRIHALAEVCTHLGGPLSEGELADDTIVCPWHGSRFSLADGSVVGGPATFTQTSFDTRIRNGQIELRLSR
jgi:nitrite reductase/ring-hydroxylating ferredoxin subunit/uncharacterized membrane protein